MLRSKVDKQLEIEQEQPTIKQLKVEQEQLEVEQDHQLEIKQVE
jgi:hypothetical protein